MYVPDSLTVCSYRDDGNELNYCELRAHSSPDQLFLSFCYREVGYTCLRELMSLGVFASLQLVNDYFWNSLLLLGLLL